MMGVAASVTLDAAGRCVKAGLALCNAGPTPMRAPAAAQMLVGQVLAAEVITAAAARAREEVSPNGNVHCTAAYQSHLAGVLSRRALASAGARALQGAKA
jgi:carbon-monoxide dehydrogenase medium subunit